MGHLAALRKSHVIFYCINMKALLENTPLVKFMRNYIRDIRDSGGVFSISSLVKILMTSLSNPVLTAS